MVLCKKNYIYIVGVWCELTIFIRNDALFVSHYKKFFCCKHKRINMLRQLIGIDRQQDALSLFAVNWPKSKLINKK